MQVKHFIMTKKNNMITVKGLENIKGAIQKNERVIFFGIHQSNWEILVPTIDFHVTAPLAE